jgi:hypothetical protein
MCSVFGRSVRGNTSEESLHRDEASQPLAAVLTPAAHSFRTKLIQACP